MIKIGVLIQSKVHLLVIDKGIKGGGGGVITWYGQIIH